MTTDKSSPNNQRSVSIPRSNNPQFVELPPSKDPDLLKLAIFEILVRHHGLQGAEHFSAAANELVDAARVELEWNISRKLGSIQKAVLVIRAGDGEVLSRAWIDSDCWPFWGDVDPEIEELTALLGDEVRALYEARRILLRSTPPAAVRRRAERMRGRLLIQSRADLRRQIEDYARMLAGVEDSYDETIDWNDVRAEIDAAVGEVVCELVMHE